MALGSYVTKFTTKLDKILEVGTKTADLNMNGDLLGELSGAGEIKVAKLAMDGLANYGRSSGFVAGSVTSDWETMKLSFDRGREFEVDAVDDEERAAVISANLMNEFARTKVVPEVDAVRFMKLASNAGKTVAANLSAAAATVTAVRTGEAEVQDKGAELSECILYCTATVKNLIRDAQPYYIAQGENPNGKFTTFDEMKIVTVPSARFQTVITLLDGTTEDQEAGGFETASTSKAINFLIVHPSACAAIQKHEKLRYFSPEVNQKKDAHLWQYRLFHDLLVYENKKGLIYCHTAAGA